MSAKPEWERDYDRRGTIISLAIRLGIVGIAIISIFIYPVIIVAWGIVVFVWTPIFIMHKLGYQNGAAGTLPPPTDCIGVEVSPTIARGWLWSQLPGKNVLCSEMKLLAAWT